MRISQLILCSNLQPRFAKTHRHLCVYKVLVAEISCKQISDHYYCCVWTTMVGVLYHDLQTNHEGMLNIETPSGTCETLGFVLWKKKRKNRTSEQKKKHKNPRGTTSPGVSAAWARPVECCICSCCERTGVQQLGLGGDVARIKQPSSVNGVFPMG